MPAAFEEGPTGRSCFPQRATSHFPGHSQKQAKPLLLYITFIEQTTASIHTHLLFKLRHLYKPVHHLLLLLEPLKMDKKLAQEQQSKLKRDRKPPALETIIEERMCTVSDLELDEKDAQVSLFTRAKRTGRNLCCEERGNALPQGRSAVTSPWIATALSGRRADIPSLVSHLQSQA